MKCLQLAVVAFALMFNGLAIGSEEPSSSEGKAEVTESAAYIEDSELSVEMARDGQFGRIKSRDMEKIESAHARIVELLTPVNSPSELPPQLRQSLALAQSQIDAILKPEDADRKICKRVPSTGTRLGALECLTLAERRERARASRNMVNDAQRGFCIAGEGTPCTFSSGG